MLMSVELNLSLLPLLWGMVASSPQFSDVGYFTQILE